MGWVIWLPLVGVLLASLAYQLGLIDARNANQPHPPILPQPSSTSSGGTSPSNSEVQYTALVQMVTYEAQNFWNITAAFLVAETIIAAIATGKREDATAAVATHLWLFPAIGLAISTIWLAALIRSLAYTKLRIHQARELERVLGFTIFATGATMSKHGVAEADGEPIRMGLLGRAISIRRGGILLAMLFALLFAYLFQQGWDSIPPAAASQSTAPAP